MAIRAETEFTRGKVGTAIEILDKAIDSTERTSELITFYTSKGLMHFANGDTFSAIKSFKKSRWFVSNARRRDNRYRFFGYLANGFISQAAGEASLAEKDIEKALGLLNDTFFYFILYDTIDFSYIRSFLVANLLSQGRIAEAELAARTAIVRRPFYLESRDFSAGTAQLWIQLAAVYLEMNRLDDADFAVKVALNMIEYDCSLPESLPFLKAREMLARIQVLR